MADIYSRMAKLGLLNSGDRKDAALMGLLQLGGQLANRGAPRLSPTPPPIDLGAAMKTYQQGMSNAMTRNMMTRKLGQEEERRAIFTDPSTYKGFPNASPALMRLAQRMGKAGAPSAGPILLKALEQKPQDIKKIGDNKYAIWNPNKGTYKVIGDNKSSMFRGTGKWGQSARILLDLTEKITNKTADPQEERAYSIAYQTLGKDSEERRFGPQGQTIIVKVPGLDLSGFPKPKSPTVKPTDGQPTDPVLSDKGEKVVSEALPSKPSDAEAKAYMFSQRMEQAQRILTKIEKAHGGKAYLSQAQVLASRIPMVGDYAQRKIMSPEQQQYLQAALDWMMATLRDESGAAINKEEAERQYSRYFPEPGDDIAVVTQKTAAREVATQAMQSKATPAKIYSDAVRKLNPGTSSNSNDTQKPEDIRRVFGLPSKGKN